MVSQGLNTAADVAPRLGFRSDHRPIHTDVDLANETFAVWTEGWNMTGWCLDHDKAKLAYREL
eukprot:3773019-Lingulodinium_polyedra.AAC.1